MAKPLKFPEEMPLRLPEGTKARIKAVLTEDDMASFVRGVIERELKRRERTHRRPADAGDRVDAPRD